MESINPQQIIAITNRKLCKRPFFEQIERVCQFKPKAIILREKDLSAEDYFKLQAQVTAICAQYNVTLIPHFFEPKISTPYLHLPFGYFKKNAKTLCSNFHIGVSIHSAEEARLACQLGASYLIAGNIYTTTCKPGLPAKGLSYLKEICETSTLPVYGIGGIKRDSSQIKEVLDQGAAGACIMSDMMIL